MQPPCILAKRPGRIPWLGVWWAAVPQDHKELGTTERVTQSVFVFVFFFKAYKFSFLKKTVTSWRWKTLPSRAEGA